MLNETEMSNITASYLSYNLSQSLDICAPRFHTPRLIRRLLRPNLRKVSYFEPMKRDDTVLYFGRRLMEVLPNHKSLGIGEKGRVVRLKSQKSWHWRKRAGCEAEVRLPAHPVLFLGLGRGGACQIGNNLCEKLTNRAITPPPLRKGEKKRQRTTQLTALRPTPSSFSQTGSNRRKKGYA
jgi:hypothetical protein